MTIRSMPPASLAFRGEPGAAPPPTIGSPRAIMARKFFNRADFVKLVIGLPSGTIAAEPAPDAARGTAAREPPRRRDR